MFQYAAGRSMALAREQLLLLDISGFSINRGHNGFELDRVFLCPTEIATEADLRDILGWQPLSRIKMILARRGLSTFRNNKLVLEPHFQYWPDINHAPPDCYLSGYWQSESYFKSFENNIRQDFTFREPLFGQNADLALAISNTRSVSLHVRRGDYLNSAYHEICSLDYYRTAIFYISERLAWPYFFIFSDDIAWVKAHLKIDFPCHYVEHNQGNQSYQDMQLMSLCRHHIIANSTFSWWGAWLNPNPEKIVVAPKKWFTTTNKNNTQDLFPQNWVRL